MGSGGLRGWLPGPPVKDPLTMIPQYVIQMELTMDKDKAAEGRGGSVSSPCSLLSVPLLAVFFHGVLTKVFTILMTN